MNTVRSRRRPGIVRRVLSLASEAAREQRALARAAKRMPKPVPWDWAAPRLLPLLSGPSLDPADLRTVRARSALGPVVEFGLDLGRVFAIVDEDVAQRWEVTSGQLLERSLVNLRARAARIEPSQVTHGVMSGHGLRSLSPQPHWASSVILDEGTVLRLFGAHDQILATPTRRTLISLPIDTPSRLVADIVVDMEVGQLHPLLLDPFIVEDGAIIWGGEMDEPDE